MSDKAKATVMVVMGTRPEAIKLAPVILELKKSEKLTPYVVSTGQHREMLDQVNEVFGIVPDGELDVFQPGQTLNSILGKVISRIDEVLAEIEPAAIVVQGDTTTVAGAAIAGFNRSVPVVHVEAGLRSGNLFDPFPEEANRKLTGQVTSLHLAPTEQSKANLVAEAMNPDTIAVTGNTVIDALLFAAETEATFTDPQLTELAESGKRVLLTTAHRRENLGENMNSIGKALAELAHAYPEDVILFPIHRNPKVRSVILPHIEHLDNVIVTEPLPYSEFCHALKMSHIVLTDSGGVQEEAPSLSKPVLVMRLNTERPEAISAGTAKLVGTETSAIVTAVATLKDSQVEYDAMAHAVSPYGDGRAAERIVAAIEELLGVGSRMDDFTYVGR